MASITCYNYWTEHIAIDSLLEIELKLLFFIISSNIDQSCIKIKQACFYLVCQPDLIIIRQYYNAFYDLVYIADVYLKCLGEFVINVKQHNCHR